MLINISINFDCIIGSDFFKDKLYSIWLNLLALHILPTIATAPFNPTPGPRSIGRPKHQRVMTGSLQGESFVGNQAQLHRGLLALEYPMEHGIIENWADMEQVWAYMYGQNEMSMRSEEVSQLQSFIYIYI